MCLKQRLMMKQVSTNSIPKLSNSNALCLFISNFSFNVIADKQSVKDVITQTPMTRKSVMDVATQTINITKPKPKWAQKLWTLLLNVDIPPSPQSIAQDIINNIIEDVVRVSEDSKKNPSRGKQIL